MSGALFAALGVALVATSVAACSTGDASLRRAARGPDRAQFNRVSPALVTRCGSLDCHGTPYRSLRLFGLYGLRLDPTHAPDTVVRADSEAGQREVQANYEAVIGLEPEVMTTVLAEGGKGADRLSLLRKGYGLDDHKGGPRLRSGDAADKCLLSWLAGAVDVGSCDLVPAEDALPPKPPRDAGATPEGGTDGAVDAPGD